MKIEIKHRWTTACLAHGEGETENEALLAAVKTAFASGANLHGADLHCADLRGADLRGANLHGADLHCADLRGADLHCANLHGADLHCANLVGADLHGADLRGADLHGADLHGANLVGADLHGADLRGADLRGANLGKVKAKTFKVFCGLYEYIIFAIVADDGTAWVRMGCQLRSVEEWDRITIRGSRLSEFPDDGSVRSEQRARAFEFARQEALHLAAEVRA